MAHFAEIDADGIVTRVIVVSSADMSIDGVENEAKGIAFCKSLFGQDTDWVQTSYTGKIRKRYAGVGYLYDSSLDAFIPPQPYPSWHLDPETCDWAAPVPMPSDGNVYMWDESTQSWVRMNTNVLVD